MTLRGLASIALSCALVGGCGQSPGTPDLAGVDGAAADLAGRVDLAGADLAHANPDLANTHINADMSGSPDLAGMAAADMTPTTSGADMVTVTKPDMTTIIGADMTTVVGTDMKTVIGADMTTIIDTDMKTVIGTDMTTVVGADMTTVVGADLANATGDLSGPSDLAASSDLVVVAVADLAGSPPSAPQSVSATAAAASAQVSWAPPQSSGTSAITGYKVSSVPAGGSASVGPGIQTAMITGLADGTTYVFDVVASNDSGDSLPGVSNMVTTFGVPSAPTSLAVTLGYGIATLTFNPPANANGSGITGYTVSATANGVTVSTTTVKDTGGNPEFRVVFEGLTDGASYTFSVTATNGIGTGPAASVTQSLPCGGLGLPGGPLVEKTDYERNLASTFAGDFNGDGKLDVLGFNSGVRQMWAGQGNDTFVRGRETEAGHGDLVLVGDFNQDGFADIVADYQGLINVALGDGHGGYTDFVEDMLGAIATAGAAGDVNGDGKLDAIFAIPGSYSVFLGDNSGNFPQRSDVNLGAVDIPAMALGDLNQDQHLDLVLGVATASGSEVRVALGNDDGTFATPVAYTVPGVYTNHNNGDSGSMPMVLVDLDGDGHLDVVTAGNINGVVVMLGGGGGTLGAARTFATPCDVHALAVADLDGDGKLDVVAGGNGSCSVLSNGNRNTPPGFLHVLLGDGLGGLGAASTLAFPPVADRGLALGDFDGDGVLDLVASPGVDLFGFAVLHGTGDGSFVLPAITPAPTNLVTIGVTSLAGDGTLDTVALGWVFNTTTNRYDIQTVVNHVNADGTLQPSVVSTPVAGAAQQWLAMALGDLDGDGKPDMLAVEPGSPAAFDVLVNAGGGAFVAGKRYTFTTGGAGSPKGVIADVDHDGNPDVVINTTTEILIFPGKGDGSFGLAYAPPQDMTDNGNFVACTDLNGDGNPDLLAPYQGTILVSLGNGDFTFQSPVALPHVVGVGPMLVSDMNRDGNLDLVFFTNSGVTVLLGDGTGAFPTAQASATDFNTVSPGTPNDLAVADMDGDSIPDAVISGDFGTVGVMFGAGDGTFPLELTYPAGVNVTNLALHDLDGDGRPDVVAILANAEASLSGVATDVLLNRSLAACY